MRRPFISGKIAIGSMRDSGFQSAAHALAELIDNSIQAGADRVELITFETRKNSKNSTERATKQIEKIGVLDNGRGMSPETLCLALVFGASENKKDSLGIGKFGMGLPNSSISQCKHVDVWSWQSPEEIYYTYLDIDEIEQGTLETVPDPVKKKIPADIRAVCGETLPKSGTLVLWSTIDRCQWKTGKSIFKHTQDLVGRMYRNFLNKDKVLIRFKSAELNESLYILGQEEKFLPNDPMYLIKKTSLDELPGEFSGESMFELADEYEFNIADEHGVRQKIKITGSYIKESVAKELRCNSSGYIGSTKYGKHAAKNYGLSVVRSGRELALLPEFINPPKVKEKGRWYGIQIEFDPSLDNIFGVTNNKQHVVNLRMVKPSEAAEREGFDSEAEYIADLRANNDPKLKIYEIVDHIVKLEKKIVAKRIAALELKGSKFSASKDHQTISSATSRATSIANAKNDAREETHPTEEPPKDIKKIKDILIAAGSVDPDKWLTNICEHNLKVLIEEAPLATNAFFDVTTKKGLTLLQINKNHVFYSEILEKVPPAQRETIEIALAGWARMERETSSKKRLEQLQMTRRDWGQLLEDYLGDENDAA